MNMQLHVHVHGILFLRFIRTNLRQNPSTSLVLLRAGWKIHTRTRTRYMHLQEFFLFCFVFAEKLGELRI